MTDLEKKAEEYTEKNTRGISLSIYTIESIYRAYKDGYSQGQIDYLKDTLDVHLELKKENEELMNALEKSMPLKLANQLKKENEELKENNNKLIKEIQTGMIYRGLEEQIEELKAQIEKMKSETNTVYIAFVYVNDCLNDVVSFGTLEKAEEYKKSKDSFNPCCVVDVNIEQHYLR